jgi:hypothetical protein
MNTVRIIRLIAIMLVLWVAAATSDKNGKPRPSQANNASEDAEISQIMTVTSQSESGEQINWQVISNGGSIDGVSTNYLLGGTIGQTATGSGGSDNFGLRHGFWQSITESCECSPGDANNDGAVNVGDAVYIINYVFQGGPPPIPHTTCSGDANGDCNTDVGDAVYIINYVFKNGPPPVTCEQWLINCGSPLRM